MHKAFYDPSIMAHKAKKGIHLCVGLGQCTFHDRFQIQIAGLHTLFGNLVCKVVDLFFEKITF